MICYLISLIFIFIPLLLFSQEKDIDNNIEKLVLNNGKVYYGEASEINKDYVVFNILKKKHKYKMKIFDMDDIYSIKWKNGITHIYYEPDYTKGFFYSAEQMKYFIKGEQYAINNYKNLPIAFASFIFSSSLSYIMGNKVSNLTLAPAFTLTVSLFPIKKINQTAFEENINYNQFTFFNEGYYKIAGRKRERTALVWGFAGTITGVSLWYLIKN